MKTNNIIIRPMGAFVVEQRTRDAMFNATNLVKQWNDTMGDNKEVKEFFKNKNTSEFIDALIKEENLDGENSTYVKSRASRGSNAGTWMHPFLFIKFAMWLNPRFEVQVIKFVYDEMIKYRNEVGDAYRKLGASVGKLVDNNFMPVAMSNISKAINFIVFGNHEKLMRNKVGEEGKQKELLALEIKLADLINDGFIKTYSQLIEYLRRKWSEKYVPKVLGKL